MKCARVSHLSLALGALVASMLWSVSSARPAIADDRPELSIYGTLQLDFIIDDARTSNIQRPLYVVGENGLLGGDNSARISMHPRSSRLGLSMREWEVSELDGEGRLEVDFQGNGAVDGSIRLRHAYFALSAGRRVELLIGHTWDVIAPLFPTANRETMMWNAGNVGERRPQVRLSVMPTDRHRVAVAMAMNGAGDGQGLEFAGRRDGEASGVPMFQWLIEYRMRWISEFVSRFGVWGHVGEDELGDGTEYRAWSVGGHVFLALSERTTLFGEVFHGRNVDDIRGGIGQGVNLSTARGIRATGGWLELAYVASSWYMLAIGGTVDDPDGRDLNDLDRTRNATFYVVNRLRANSKFQLSMEYVRWHTSYLNAPSAAANRYNVHLSMSF